MKVNITKLYEPPVCSVADIIMANKIILQKQWKCRSNNWLKIHGYPMRRRH